MSNILVMSSGEKEATLRQIESDGLYAVVTGTAIESWGGDVETQVLEHARALKAGGVSTFEVTCRIPNWVEVAGYVVDAAEKVDGLIPAVGTHANVLTLYQATELGIKVNVAAHGLTPLAGDYAAVPGQKQIAKDFANYVVNNIDDFCGALDWSQEDAYRENPLTMDPIAFCRARGVIVIPSFNNPTQLYDLINRGAHDGQKAYPFFSTGLGLEYWQDVLKAISDVYRDVLRVCATGGINAENLEEVLSIKGIATAGASSLIGETPQETERNAAEYREIVERSKKT